MARLKEKYRSQIAPALAKEFGIENPMAVPRVEKIVLNMGVGEAIANSKALDLAADELRSISGQKPVITKAKKIHRFIQTAPGNEHRNDGHSSRRKNV